MSAPIPKDIPLVRASDLEQSSRPAKSAMDLTGRLAHFRGVGTTTLAAGLTARAQAAGQTVAWISATADVVYPPDLAAAGVDLRALTFVFAADALQAARTAEHLLRSRAFALLVVDLEDGAGISDAAQGRLLRLARNGEAGVLCISHGDRPLRGSMISLRGAVSRERSAGGRYHVRVRITRDKQGGPGMRSGEVCYAPPGMR
jgi:recombination protein RecA